MYKRLLVSLSHLTDTVKWHSLCECRFVNWVKQKERCVQENQQLGSVFSRPCRSIMKQVILVCFMHSLSKIVHKIYSIHSIPNTI